MAHAAHVENETSTRDERASLVSVLFFPDIEMKTLFLWTHNKTQVRLSITLRLFLYYKKFHVLLDSAAWVGINVSYKIMLQTLCVWIVLFFRHIFMYYSTFYVFHLIPTICSTLWRRVCGTVSFVYYKINLRCVHKSMCFCSCLTIWSRDVCYDAWIVLSKSDYEL